MITITYDIDDIYAILSDCLNEYQIKALNDAISGFGYNMNTLDTMIYVWYGMDAECFIDLVIG